MLYVPAHGGANKANRLLMEGLAMRGHPCRVVAPAGGLQNRETPTAFLDELTSRGIAFDDSPTVTTFECNDVHVCTVKNPSQLLRQAVREIRAFEPMVTLVSSFTQLGTIVEQRDTRTVYAAHSPWELPFGPGHALDHPAGVELLRRTDAIITVSKDMQQRIRQGCGREAAVMAFPVYGKGPFPRLARCDRGFVTMINPCAYKGISIFSATAGRMPHLRFAAVPGWGTTTADMNLLKRYANITILEPCDDIQRILEQTTLLLVPSLWPEAFGLIVVEAMTHGIPVVASNSGGLPEAKLGMDYVLPIRPIERYRLLCDERGLPIPTVPQQDIDPWVETIEKLTTNRRHYQQLSGASREAALRFVSSLTIDPFEDFLETVARTPRVSPKPDHRADAPKSPTGDLPTCISRLPPAKRALLAARLTQHREDAPRRPRIPRLPRRPGFNEFPLSFAQQRLWFIERLELTRSHYSPPQGIRLRGRLNVGALEWSIHEVVRRHEVLRTSFPIRGDGPVQHIAPSLSVELAVTNLQAAAAPERGPELDRTVSEEAQRPFDLVNGPLIRTRLLRLTNGESILLLSIHHLVCDGWSLGVLFRELERLYNARIRNEPALLGDLTIQYADYAVWQRQHLTGVVLDTQLAYWKEQLGPDVPVLQLPTDRPRPPVQTYRGAGHHVELTEALTERLKVLSEREGVTLFMTLLAGFKVLLHRHSGQARIAVGSPIANRHHKETEGLIGFFVNTLVLCTNLSGNPTFRVLLRRVRDVALGAYAHQDFPFEKLVEALQPERDLSRGPLFQVFFNMLNYDDELFELDGLTTEIVPFTKREARFDLTLYARERDGRIALDLLFNPDLFDETRMIEMLAQLQALLTQAVEDPDETILNISLVTDGAQAILPDPARILCDETRGTVHDEFNASAIASPKNVAVIDAGQAVRYGELRTCANRIADALSTNGVRPGDVVAIYSPRGAALVASVIGVLKAGAAFMILDPSLPSRRLAAQISATRPRILIEVADAGDPSANLDEPAASIPYRLTIPGRISALADVLRDHSTEDPKRRIDPCDPAYVLPTSGSTTGEPKAILGTHKPLTHFLQWYCRTFGLNASDRFSMLSGLSHDPLLRDIFTPLRLGATLCIPEQEDWRVPGRLADWMRRRKITVAHMTPAMTEVLATPADERPAPCIGSLRYVFFGGDVLTTRTVTKVTDLAPNATCVNFYGATETPQAMGFYVVPSTNAATREGPLGSAQTTPIGKGIDGAQLLILNKAGRMAGIGELGEICVRTPYLSDGYIEDATLTALKFIPNPFTVEPEDRIYRTGDRGRYDPDGNVQFHGRADRQVKVRGFRIEPVEIESALMSHDAVDKAVVTISNDDHTGKKLIACIVCKETVSTLSLRGYLRRRLPEYMIPAQFTVVESIPLTPNNKVDERRLRQLAHRPTETRAFVPPSTPMERHVAEIWQRVLGIGKVGLRDNFFDLGGHSLMVVKAVSQIEKKIGIRVPFKDFFGQTLGQFAAGCERVSGAGAS